jgi:hypothetical protein
MSYRIWYSRYSAHTILGNCIVRYTLYTPRTLHIVIAAGCNPSCMVHAALSNLPPYDAASLSTQSVGPCPSRTAAPLSACWWCDLCLTRLLPRRRDGYRSRRQHTESGAAVRGEHGVALCGRRNVVSEVYSKHHLPHDPSTSYGL